MYFELTTPSVIVDLDIVERNILQMAERLSAQGIQHRPHIKTTKSVYFARKQLEAGAIGITAAKLGEAETFARAGIDNILIAFPLIGEDKLRRFEALHSQVHVIAVVDSLEGATGLSAVGERSGLPVSVLIEIDGGLHRGGRQPGDDTLSFARELAVMPGIRIYGIMGYFGMIYRNRDEQGLRQAVGTESVVMQETVSMLRDAGFAIEIISAGSTPSALLCEDLIGVTEVRAGNYIFFDASGVSLGLAKETDCALRVIATVVSTPFPGRATIDSGTKTLTSDLAHHRDGFGIVVGRPELRITGLNEEHGFLEFDPFQTMLSVGDRIEIIPNHSCVVSNLCDAVNGVRGGVFEMSIPVDARGRND
ncbi:amino acid processing protein [Paenibacillus sp. LMG 31456]|uniref:Amino acid processing protein n=1 Tax=Paenibacillus foliorum TaxID=2654974 RepID=A0A972GK47_9BACL|nr:alanine racemase [Paenibacillus foliorum]NOU92276.1 amino acid processing protein [Paenibacillus foliorum]